MTVVDAIIACIRDFVPACVGNAPLVTLNRLFPEPGVEVIAKLELMNPSGSMKDRPAILRRRGVDVVYEPDDSGGYLQTRIRRMQELLHAMPTAVWINQYAHERNWQAYYYGTGAEMCEQLVRPPDYLFAAVSATGSILGCSRRLRERFPNLGVIAVDAAGSIIFGGTPGRREIPGIGTSRVPELLRPEEIAELTGETLNPGEHWCRDERVLWAQRRGAVSAPPAWLALPSQVADLVERELLHAPTWPRAPNPPAPVSGALIPMAWEVP